MIPRPDIASWARDHPWPSGDQVEQEYVEAFELYKPKGVNGATLATNLRAKIESDDYCTDCDLLIRGGAESLGFRAHEAAALVESELLSQI